MAGIASMPTRPGPSCCGKSRNFSKRDPPSSPEYPPEKPPPAYRAPAHPDRRFPRCGRLPRLSGGGEGAWIVLCGYAKEDRKAKLTIDPKRLGLDPAKVLGVECGDWAGLSRDIELHQSRAAQARGDRLEDQAGYQVVSRILSTGIYAMTSSRFLGLS
jgi:hypothetical protein